MSNLPWLRTAVREKADEIMDLSDEYWDDILSDINDAPEDLKKSPNSLGKFAVVGTVGLMMYLPGNARTIAAQFGRGAHVETGTMKHVKDKGYMGKVSQGIEAVARTVQLWESQLGEKTPKITDQAATERMRNFKPLFKELLSKRLSEEQKKRAMAEMVKQDGREAQGSLIGRMEEPQMMEDEDVQISN